MKKFGLVVSVLTVILLLFTLTSCALSQNDGENGVVMDTVSFYECKNGELNTRKWISFIDDEWLYYDRSFGTYEVTGDRYTLKTNDGVWATGSLVDGNFYLDKDGQITVYYGKASKLPQEKNALTMQMVYEKAVDLGFEGTLEELIDLFRGDAGESAYDLAVKHGYRGTETQWIASLAGSDGKTPSIGENGHWMVGDVDTGVSASGTGIQSMTKTDSENNVDTYTFLMTDGTTYSFTVTNGLDGEASARGTGIEKIEKTASVNGLDTYTITLTDGTSSEFTVQNGKNGVDGKDAPALTPEDLYNEAVAKGYTGTYFDFLASYLPSSSDSSSIRSSCFSTVRIMSVYKYNFLGATLTGNSSGTGIIYQMNKDAGDAYIVTNYHVVYAAERVNDAGEAEPGIADQLFVYLFGSEIIGNEYYTNVDYPGMYMEAEYIGGSMNYDIAVLKINGSDRIKNSNAKAVTFSDSNKVGMGDTVYAVGNGGGEGIAITKGILNYTSETLSMTGADNVTSVQFRVMRYDAAVNPGNSGGALLNERGELIGVVNAKMIDQKYDNVGYAIPSNVAKNVVENVLYYYEKTGETPVAVKKLLFGISYTNSESYAEFDQSTGEIILKDNLRVASVNETSLVVGQIEAGDVVTGVSVERGGEITEYELVRAYILADLTLTIRAGDKVTLTYERVVDGETTTGQAVVEVTEENLVVSQ